MKLGIFLSVFSKTANGNALNAEATTQEIKYHHLHVNNPSSPVTVCHVCQATLCTDVRLRQHHA